VRIYDIEAKLKKKLFIFSFEIKDISKIFKVIIKDRERGHLKTILLSSAQ
jgi:hypothetical protein